jgi:hypothetical protein
VRKKLGTDITFSNSCKITMCFDGFLFMLDVAPQYSLHPIKSLEARSNIYLHHADFGDTSAEQWYI